MSEATKESGWMPIETKVQPMTEHARMKELPPVDLLRKMLDYNPDTGAMTWRDRDPSMFDEPTRDEVKHQVKSFNRQFSGKDAGHVSPDGYRHVKIQLRKYKAHRIAWAIATGSHPEGSIDHINGDRSDNRLSNLRVVTHAENQRNKGRQWNSTSGATGVSWDRRDKRWRAYIDVDGRKRHLGMYSQFEAAVAAREAADREYGYHVNHGRVGA